jgi:hypothetical protein
MLEAILRHLNNYFIADVREGDYAVEGGNIALPFLADGQYFFIRDSIFNDGLHRNPAFDLVDEEFYGVIWCLAIPQAIINLADEIEAWQTKNAEILNSPYTSESFGGYSYTKASGDNGAAVSWQSVFADRLTPYRKPREVGYMR